MKAWDLNDSSRVLTRIAGQPERQVRLIFGLRNRRIMSSSITSRIRILRRSSRVQTTWKSLGSLIMTQISVRTFPRYGPVPKRHASRMSPAQCWLPKQNGTTGDQSDITLSVKMGIISQGHSEEGLLYEFHHLFIFSRGERWISGMKEPKTTSG